MERYTADVFGRTGDQDLLRYLDLIALWAETSDPDTDASAAITIPLLVRFYI